MPDTPPATPIRSPLGRALSARVGLARAAVFWERSWPEFAAALGVLGVFVAAAVLGLPAMAPGWVHAGVLAGLRALVALPIRRRIPARRIPAESESRGRIEAASGP